GTSLFNNGTLSGSGRIGLKLVNNSAGTVRALPGDTLNFTGSGGNSNAGTIDLVGGSIVMTDALTNASAGRIVGQGNLIVAGGTTNSGSVTLSGGTTQIEGAFTNNAGANVTVTGGSQSTF